jgi:hypothetical protein
MRKCGQLYNTEGGAVCSFEASANIHHTWRRHSPKDGSLLHVFWQIIFLNTTCLKMRSVKCESFWRRAVWGVQWPLWYVPDVCSQLPKAPLDDEHNLWTLCTGIWVSERTGVSPSSACYHVPCRVGRVVVATQLRLFPLSSGWPIPEGLARYYSTRTSISIGRAEQPRRMPMLHYYWSSSNDAHVITDYTAPNSLYLWSSTFLEECRLLGCYAVCLL